MSDGVLSQEEIDALLRSNAVQSTADDVSVDFQTSGDSGDLTMAEKDALSELFNKVMESSASALSTLLEKPVIITAPYIETTDSEKIKNEHPNQFLMVYYDYTGGLQGTNALLFKNGDAAAMVDLMMGGAGAVSETSLDEMQMGAFNEAMNQMLGSATSTMSAVLKKTAEITPPALRSLHLPEETLSGFFGGADENLVKISYRISIDDVLDSEILQLIPLNLARTIIKDMGIESNAGQTLPSQPETVPQPHAEAQQQVAATAQAASAYTSESPAFAMPQGAAAEVKSGTAKKEIPVQPVQFAPLQPNFNASEISNIDLIMDVPLQLTVELGRSKKTIREILALGQGSVIELDKLAGEPVDLLVNGKLLAKGEVVVIDENFGIRVSDIISPIERVTSLQ